MTIEQELIKATRLRKKAEEYDDRQDYLAAVTRAVDKLKDEFDNLSDEAVIWHRAAVEAMNDKEPIPDFDTEVEDDEPDQATEDPADFKDETVPDTGEELDPDDEDSQAEPERDPDGAADDEPGVPETDEGEPDVEPEVVPGKAAKKGAKAKPKATKPVKAPKPKPPIKSPDYSKITGEKDRYGIVIGTKTHAAVLMYEKGSTAKAVEDEVGGRHRNILKQLAERGHLVERLEGGVYRVTHLDDRKKGK